MSNINDLRTFLEDHSRLEYVNGNYMLANFLSDIPVEDPHGRISIDQYV